MRQRDRRTIYGHLGRHPVHPFPARMAPEIVSKCITACEGQLRVLDPMAGSGTVLALARARNHRAIGFDIDPLAVLIAKVWTTPIVHDNVFKRAEIVLNRAEKRARRIAAGDAYPRHASAETRAFVRYWFDLRSRTQLAALADAISRVHGSQIRDVLWCAFSRLIISKQAGASLALDLPHSRPHRTLTKAVTKPFLEFLNEVSFVLRNSLSASGKERGPRVRVKHGDARNLPLKSRSIDLVVTSPPYLNAIDYMRCSKFSLVWMGHDIESLGSIRRVSIGTEVGLKQVDPEISQIIRTLKLERMSTRRVAIVAAYIKDMRVAMSEVQRVLVPGGKAIYVVGENTIEGIYVENAKVVRLLGKQLGMQVESVTRRALPPNRRYLPPPTKRGQRAMNGRMRAEVILRLAKTT